jgi:hypothetical protein
MKARQRAVQVAAQVQRERAIADKTRGVTLTDLGVRVKGDEVWSLPGWTRGRCLGPLAGACAGVMDLKPGSQAVYVAAGVIGVNPSPGRHDLCRLRRRNSTRAATKNGNATGDAQGGRRGRSFQRYGGRC